MDSVAIWVPIIGTISLFGMICFVTFVVSRNRARVTQLRTEFHQKMLDKFGSAAEFVDFAKTPEGRRLLEGATMERPTDSAKLLAYVRRGIILTILGLAFLSMIWFFDADVEPTGFFGMIFLALGIAHLVSAVVSRRLLRSWRPELSGAWSEREESPE